MEAGLDRSVYERCLKWYGEEAPEALWSTLQKVRRLQRPALAEPSCSADGHAAGSSSSDGGVEKSEMEEYRRRGGPGLVCVH